MFLGLRHLPREITEFELEAFFQFSAAERRANCPPPTPTRHRCNPPIPFPGLRAEAALQAVATAAATGELRVDEELHLPPPIVADEEDPELVKALNL